MFQNILKKVFGTENERIVKSYQPIVSQINSLESRFESKTDDELRTYWQQLKEKHLNGQSLDALLPESFALTREASKRVLKMRHFDVQLMGGICLHSGKIAEMRTGEGKTLVATLPVVLNALTGKGVHVVTVNDYLARRDSEWMGQLYNFLGLSTGKILHGLSDAERKQSYAADVTYGTNNEFGFDYLRDNMKFSLNDFAQRKHHFAIVDEVDSILIDEARTPLIISGPAEESTDKYVRINAIIPRLIIDKDFTIDEKGKSCMLTEEGIPKVEKLLGIENLYDPRHIEILHHVNIALKSTNIFKRDVDYVVKEGEVLIVDEFTGRLMPGRRYSDGLHQALEAKEGVEIQRENQTLASITFQNYFRLYEKLGGMTGTAETEAEEFHKIYKLGVVVIPTNRISKRKDFDDVIYRTEAEKFHCVVEQIKECHGKGQPVLVGTVNIDKSEKLSRLLKKSEIPHHVLNAKYHEKEAEIIASAGQKGTVTIATNMAGRGTDITLGEGVAELGGLYILGTERHESRRIDNQLRGRAGRQGDAGASKFFLSLEDDLMRIFGSDRISGLMQRLGMQEYEPIEHKWINKAIENAQKKVEGHNFDIRKHLLEYDDVMNQQRTVIYGMRKRILEGEGEVLIEAMLEESVKEFIDSFYVEKDKMEGWAVPEFWEGALRLFKIDKNNTQIDIPREGTHSREDLTRIFGQAALKNLQLKKQNLGEQIWTEILSILTLQTIDHFWKDHLLALDHLREGINLRGYAQKDPLLEYKKEAFSLFTQLDSAIRQDIMSKILWVEIQKEESEQVIKELQYREEEPLQMTHGTHEEALQTPTTPVVKAKPQNEETGEKIGRNDVCPCGSGKKYKKCHGR